MQPASRLPRTLSPVRQPLPELLSRGAVDCLGEHGGASRALFDAGFVPPDVLCGMTLYLLASQARERSDGTRRRGAVAGGVWVREQFTVHRPVPLGAELCVTGESAQQFVRRGRRYGVNTSETRSADGVLLVSNCTTGLLRYRRDDALPDGEEGRSTAEIRIPAPDPTNAAANPAASRLRALRVGERIAGERARITLASMRVRDGERGDNPIHTDPEVARREGLAAPIAGGSHVLAFLLASLMRAWGPECLLYGAHLDVQWKGQTFAETWIEPEATVTRVDPSGVALALEVRGETRTALVGTLRIPAPSEAAPRSASESERS